MATTKKPTSTTRRAPRARSTAPKTSTNQSSDNSSRTNRSAATRAGKAIAKRPAASVAIATGVVSGIAAAVVGFLAFKKSGKTFSEFSGDLATSVKDKAAETSERVKDGLTDVGSIAKEQVSKLRDGVDQPKTQSEIAEEALTLKETGGKATFPNDPVVDSQTKVGSVSY